MIQAVQTPTQQITRRLRGEILSGQIESGIPLREITLAKRFGVGRAVIRQALQNLVTEGVLVSRPNCGVKVAGKQPPLVSDLLTPLRVQIETYALKQIFGTFTQADREQINLILSQLQLACTRNDPVAILDADFEFHEWLLIRAGLEEMIPIWRSVISRMRDHHQASNQKIENPLMIHDIHARLTEEILGNDHDSSTRALTEHLFDGPFNEKCRKQFRKRAQKLKATRGKS